MPISDREISYPVSISYKGKGRMYRTHNAGWVNAIHAKNGRYVYLTLKLPTGEVVVWMAAPILREFITFLEKEKRLRYLDPEEKAILFSEYKKKKTIVGR